MAGHVLVETEAGGHFVKMDWAARRWVLAAVVAMAAGSCSDDPTPATADAVAVSDADADATTTIPSADVIPADEDALPETSSEPIGSEAGIASSAVPFIRQYAALPEGPLVFTSTGVEIGFTGLEGWWVRENEPGLTVLGDRDGRSSRRHVTVFRPTALSNPDAPNVGGPGRQVIDVADIRAWTERVVPGVLASTPAETTVAGLDALHFDVRLDGLACSGDLFCVDFALGPGGDQFVDFDPETTYRVWWVDGLDHEPLVVVVSALDGEDDFFDVADELLATMTVGAVAPHPAVDADPVACGFDGPASGVVVLPVVGGLGATFTEERFVAQSGGIADVETLVEGNRIVLLSPLAAGDGDEVGSAQEALDALARLGAEVGEPEPFAMLGTDGVTAALARGTAQGTDAMLVTATGGGPIGLQPANAGRVWAVDTERGPLVVAARAGSDAAADVVVAEAEDLILTLTLESDPCPR